jgi:DNA-binding transcriptional ArsR family regulator
MKLYWKEIISTADALHLLGNNTRISILKIILENGEITPTEMLKILEKTSTSFLSNHLYKLTKSKILKSRRDATKVYYDFKSPEIRQKIITLFDIDF